MVGIIIKNIDVRIEWFLCEIEIINIVYYTKDRKRSFIFYFHFIVIFIILKLGYF
jgi:hypothetical protein